MTEVPTKTDLVRPSGKVKICHGGPQYDCKAGETCNSTPKITLGG